MNENNFLQRNCYRFPMHETIDQPEYAFIFDLETYNDQELAEAYAVGFYEMNYLRDHWVRDLTLKEIKPKKKNCFCFR